MGELFEHQEYEKIPEIFWELFDEAMRWQKSICINFCHNTLPIMTQYICYSWHILALFSTVGFCLREPTVLPCVTAHLFIISQGVLT